MVQFTEPQDRNFWWSAGHFTDVIDVYKRQQLKLTEGTDYEKEIRVHDWFCKNVKYDFKGSDMDLSLIHI